RRVLDAERMVHAGKTSSVAQQATGRGELAILIGSRHGIANGQCCKLFALAIEERIAADHEPAWLQLGHRCEDGIKVLYSARMQHMGLQPELACRRLQVL